MSTSTTTSMPSPVPLDSFLGAILIGVILSTIVYGITCLQVFLYFTEHCQRDNWILKSLVAAVWVLDSVHVALISIVIYHYAVTNFGDYVALVNATWSLLIQIVIGALLTSMVQCFFAYRVYILGRKRLLIPLFIVCVTILQTVLGTIYAARAFKKTRFAEASGALPFTLGAVASDLLCDCVIAAAMIHYLYTGRTTVPTTNRIIHLLIKYAINTCLLEALCTVPCLLMLVTKTRTLIYAPFYFFLVRLYSCSLLCSLNNRDHLRDINGRAGAITMSTFHAAARTPHSDWRTPKSSHEASHNESDAETLPAPFMLQTDAQSQERVLDVRKVENTLT